MNRSSSVREISTFAETVATQPGDFGLIPIAEALKSTTSRTGGKPNVIARGPEPCSPGISRARSRIGPGSLATVSNYGENFLRGANEEDTFGLTGFERW